MGAGLSLRHQLLLAAGVITLLLGAALLLVLPSQFDRLGQHALEKEAQALATLVAQTSGPSVATARAVGDASLAGEQLPVLRATPQVEMAAIYGSDGALLASFQTDTHGTPPTATRASSGPTGVTWNHDSLVSWQEMRDGSGALYGVVELHLSVARLEVARQENLRTAWILTLSLVVSMLLVIVFLGSRLTMPLQRLTAVAEDVAAGRSEVVERPEWGEVNAPSANELTRLTRAFFTMLERLRASQWALEAQVVEVERQRSEAEDQREQADAERARAEEVLQHLQQTQDQLVRSEKMASLGHLIAGIAHELNTPMGAVNASAEILQEHLRETLGALIRMMPETERVDLELALAVVDSARGRPRLGGREGRRTRRALRERLELRGVSSADRVADAMLEVGYRDNEPVWEEVMARADIDRVMASAEQFSPLLRNADNVRLAAQKARKIVLALKTFSHQGVSGDRTAINLADNIHMVITLYENQLKRGIRLDVQLAEDLVVDGDADALSQVWTNLMQNAIQAMNGDGRLWIRGDRSPDGRIRVVVGNDGPAIPADIQKRIFEVFFTTKPAGEGSGLGLDIVRRIVTDHGGVVRVQSDESATEFAVEFAGSAPS